MKNQQTIQERWNVCSHRTLVDDRTPGDQSILDVASRRFDLVALLAYYVPTPQAHTAMRAILSRLEEGEDHGIIFGGNAQRKDADDALRLGHLFILSVLDLQKEHFKLEVLQEQIQKVIADYNEIWLDKHGPS